MEWKLDSDSKIPIYQQVVDFIENVLHMENFLQVASSLPNGN